MRGHGLFCSLAASLSGCLPIVLLLSLMCCACTAAQRHKPMPVPSPNLPRPDPGHIQWLERQSMLGNAQELSQQVSGTDLLWRNSASLRRLPLLQSAAPHWLDVNPHALTDGQSVLRTLASPDFLTFLKEAGYQGIFFAPTGETDAVWSARPVAVDNDVEGENVVSLRLAPNLGNDKDFNSLVNALEAAHVQLGGDLPPAATGLGPDFMLQARKASRFDGVYAMLSIPREDWDVLPVTAGEWACLPLGDSAVKTLRQRGVLPERLRRDALYWGAPAGWAVTGEVRGVDGQTRRWAYRYVGSSQRPVLLWQDPSAQARRIWSAAIIRHTGLQRQTLAGFRLEGLMGLDTLPADGADKPAALAAAPLPEALATMSGEVHRYGGWSLQDDILPPSLTRTVLDAGVDFTRDNSTCALAAQALLSGDATPLAAALRASVADNVDHSRLARGVRCGSSTVWRPLPGQSAGREQGRFRQKTSNFDLDRGASVASLAARALGLDSAHVAEHQAAMCSTCLLLLGWRIGLPGLTFLSPQDLVGALDSAAAPNVRVPLWEESPLSVGRAASMAFGSLAAQWAQEDSFARQIARLLHVRHATGLAQGRLVRIVTGPPGCLAVWSALPQGGYWGLFANFSPKPQRMTCPLPDDASPHALAVADGHVFAVKNHSLTLPMGAREAQHVLIGVPPSRFPVVGEGFRPKRK